MIYPDTSFLVPLYAEEPFTGCAKDFIARNTLPVFFTPFHRFEFRTAMRMRAFQQRLPREQLQDAFLRSEEDVADGYLLHTPLNWSKALREAEQIAAAHLVEVGARSGDLLHVASAVILEAQEFVTFDRRQTALARRVGLKIRHWTRP